MIPSSRLGGRTWLIRLGPCAIEPAIVKAGSLRRVREDPTGSFAETFSVQRLSPEGRPLPTTGVGYPVAQLGSQLSGGEIARLTGAGRP